MFLTTAARRAASSFIAKCNLGFSPFNTRRGAFFWLALQRFRLFCFVALLAPPKHVRDLFVSYSEALLAQVQQTVACNALHTTEQRVSRWLLMMHDRAEGEALPYTHEFLSHMLGANRKSVTLAALLLQKAGVCAEILIPFYLADRIA
jgi:hypothetical protein